MIKIIRLESEGEVMYRIEDRINNNRDGCQQVIVLTRDELGDLHHLIDVQFMSEDPNYEESMQPLTQEEINNEMAHDDHKNKWSE
jgi:hypothetical protein|tara:strand:+ start:137 stop:391 length:255 start_codon:yes stop_codon:yes gene_type:complete